MNTIIIAEAGVNHCGSIDLAFELIDKADASGADYVKFQTFISHENISTIAPKAEYQVKFTDQKETQFEMVRKLELSFADFDRLIDYTQSKRVKFLSTPFGMSALRYLTGRNIDFIKVASGEITNFQFLESVSKLNKPVILSTGMANLGEIESALNVILANGLSREQVIILHCNTEYPTPVQDVNLKAMLSLRDAFNVRVGYSDHTLGIEVSLAAVALGASVIEKHFTLDKNLPGPDHKASLEPAELKSLVTGIRNIELAMGDGIKKATESEGKNITIARKSIIARRNILKGEIFSEDNCTAKRPGNGISPMRWNEVMGKTASKDFLEDELIEI